MTDDGNLTLIIPEPGRWVTYEWSVSSQFEGSKACHETTGLFSFRNTGADGRGHCWCETELIHKSPAGPERLIFRLLVNPAKPLDRSAPGRTGWFQLNQDQPKPFRTFSPNDYPLPARLMEQVCAPDLFAMSGQQTLSESLGVRSTEFTRGQLDCAGLTTRTDRDVPFGSSRNLRITTTRTTWQTGVVPFLGLVESYLHVDQRITDETEDRVESAWTAVLHVSDFGDGATSRMATR